MKSIYLNAAAAALVITALASCKSEPAFEQTEEIGPYTVSLIEKDVWHVEDCNSSNPHGNSMQNGKMHNNNCSDMYIIRGKDKALLIDLSNKINWAEDADIALRKIFYDRAGDRQKTIAITHNHGDHTGMLYAFENEEGIEFLLPENDYPEGGRNPFPEGKYSKIGDLSLIQLGKGMTVQTVEVKGHTPGSLVFFLKGHDIAFSGDALGSGTGVWIFSADGLAQYSQGVPRLLEYLDDPANGINRDKLTLYGGHSWQIGTLDKLDYQYVVDNGVLIKQIAEGTAYSEPYANPMLNTNYKYGTATITANKSAGDQYEQTSKGE